MILDDATSEISAYNCSMPLQDRELLEAAVIGLQIHHQRVEEAIAHIKRQLGSSFRGAAAAARSSKRRKMSAAGRARIAAAAKKRWAAFRAAKTAAQRQAAKPAPKREKKVSRRTAGKRALVRGSRAKLASSAPAPGEAASS